MGWLNKEVKAFGREFARQGSILLFGKAPKPKQKRQPRKSTGGQKQYFQAQLWARKHGFK
jgi:hypothetical protein